MTRMVAARSAAVQHQYQQLDLLGIAYEQNLFGTRVLFNPSCFLMFFFTIYSY